MSLRRDNEMAMNRLSAKRRWFWVVCRKMERLNAFKFLFPELHSACLPRRAEDIFSATPQNEHTAKIEGAIPQALTGNGLNTVCQSLNQDAGRRRVADQMMNRNKQYGNLLFNLQDCCPDQRRFV